MPLNSRIVSVRVAVGCFFFIALISWFSDLEPLICCKRAGIGAVAAYVVTTLLVRITNHILISAFVKSRMQEQNGVMSEHAN